ncbi:MAG TPA: MFS transporter [Nocardioidaceae bacterium]|jgi:MFS family permease
MLTPYRRVLAVPGALVFSLTGLVGRLPISMVSLGIVILVSGRTGSYTLAGGIAAAYLVGNAVLSVPEGRLVDRLGQSVVLPWTILVFTVALSLMVWSVVAGWPTPVPQVLAALGGAALPPIGSCVRARWSHNVPDKKQLQTAFALEAVVDETVFVVGPILVTVVATAIHPLAGLGTAIAAGLIGTLALSAQRSTQPPAHRSTGRSAPRVPLGWRVLGPLLAAGVTLGVLFGGIEVATVAFADELGAKAASGILLAVYSLGSLLAGVVSGAVRWRASVATRFRRGMAALAVSLVPLPFLSGFPAMGTALFLAGFAIAPTLIAAVAWIEQTVPTRRLTEGITILITGINVGLAPGAAAVGRVVDRFGASASYWVPLAAAAAGALFAATTLLTTRPRPGARSIASC